MIKMSKLSLYRALRSVALFSFVDISRAHLCGIKFECGRSPGGVVRLLATDGHTMINCEVRGVVGECADFFLTQDQVKIVSRVIQCKPSEDCEIEIYETRSDDGGKTVLVGMTIAGYEMKIDPNRTEFPPWRQVYPEKNDGQDEYGQCRGLVGIDPAYLSRVGKACELFSGGKRFVKNGGLSISTVGKLDPIRFDYADHDVGTLCVIVMPTRLG